jgi:hypothetical protein
MSVGTSWLGSDSILECEISFRDRHPTAWVYDHDAVRWIVLVAGRGRRSVITVRFDSLRAELDQRCAEMQEPGGPARADVTVDGKRVLRLVRQRDGVQAVLRGIGRFGGRMRRPVEEVRAALAEADEALGPVES